MAWHALKRIKNSRHEVIDWNFIVKLDELQSSEGLKCANHRVNRYIGLTSFATVM